VKRLTDKRDKTLLLALDYFLRGQLPPRLLLPGSLADRRVAVQALNVEGRAFRHDFFTGFSYYPPDTPQLDNVATILRPFMLSDEGLMPWSDGAETSALAQRQTWIAPEFRGLCEAFFSSDPQTAPARREEVLRSLMSLELSSAHTATLKRVFGVEDLPLLCVQSNVHKEVFPPHVDRPHGAGFGATLVTYVFFGESTVELSPLLFPVHDEKKVEAPVFSQDLPAGSAYKLQHRARYCCTHGINKARDSWRYSVTLRFGVSPVMLSHLCTNQLARSPSFDWRGCHKDCCHRGDCVACHGLLFLP